jgi:hypothetical protein
MLVPKELTTPKAVSIALLHFLEEIEQGNHMVWDGDDFLRLQDVLKQATQLVIAHEER